MPALFFCFGEGGKSGSECCSPVSVDEEHARIALHVGFGNTKFTAVFLLYYHGGKHQSLGVQSG